MQDQRAKIHVIGHSHIAALGAAASIREEGGDRFAFFELQKPPYKPAISGGVVNPALLERITAILESIENPAFALSIGGAFHSVVALANHPSPYYVVGPWLGYDPGSEQLIPFSLMREVMREKMSWQLEVIRTIADVLPQRVINLQPPPPLPDAEFIKESPGVYQEVIEAHGVMPAEVRYTVWRIQSDLFEEACRENDIEFLHAPPATVDDRGFLAREAWRADPTHGNAWYGEQVLQQVERYFETRKRAS